MDGAGTRVLIDCGPPSRGLRACGGATTRNASLRPVSDRRIILTHAYLDHCGFSCPPWCATDQPVPSSPPAIPPTWSRSCSGTAPGSQPGAPSARQCARLVQVAARRCRWARRRTSKDDDPGAAGRAPGRGRPGRRRQARIAPHHPRFRFVVGRARGDRSRPGPFTVGLERRVGRAVHPLLHAAEPFESANVLLVK